MTKLRKLVLGILEEYGAMSPVDIHGGSDGAISLNGIYTMLHRMEKAGLIEKLPKDGKKVQYRATAAGVARAQEVLEEVEDG